MGEQVEFSIVEGRLCVAKLPHDTELESIRRTAPFFSCTETLDEISIVAQEFFAHPGAEIERGWRAIKLKGPFDFELKGILLSILNPLAAADIGVFAVSTYSTDYILVKELNLERAIEALVSAGHTFNSGQK